MVSKTTPLKKKAFKNKSLQFLKEKPFKKIFSYKKKTKNKKQKKQKNKKTKQNKKPFHSFQK